MKNIQPLFEPVRVPLSQKVPLMAPMSVSIEPSSICNFQCKYCAQALGGQFESRHFKKELMSMETFRLLADQLKEFGTIKKIHLFRNGEPLCNPNLAQMVHILMEEQICETINISTNAALLTPERSDALIEAGLTMLTVSLQGLNDAKYEEMCGAKVSFQKIYDNLSYFYEHRKNCKLFIKIIDIAMDTKEEEEQFYALFSPIADRVYIESAVPVYESINYEGMLRREQVTRSGMKKVEPLVCQLVFFHLHILANGDIVPCNSIEFPMTVRNIHDLTLHQFWNSKERTDFLKQQLLGRRRENKICSSCQRLYQEFQPDDDLDGQEDEILKRLEKANEKE